MRLPVEGPAGYGRMPPDPSAILVVDGFRLVGVFTHAGGPLQLLRIVFSTRDSGVVCNSNSTGVDRFFVLRSDGAR